ncbi:peptide deformylase [Treponema putidum]|uniref:Peptide deformylase n=1 Tax=Treponema putidum TaxID=221027 RepID=A0AAE9MUX2_9SPIR|nr:peptide deformylase [Treponema putidum]AIN94645.1 peptide deformylase [Treponema putidum]TWI78750.1 peptide deformylase [Treponema putidum]UTY28668.1 peptide deformylase [Treponema putidum]UTY31102.1 peptide deformylase [Treponema putidum]UTY33533.1 peptide deformylase [Treponema putidum]
MKVLYLGVETLREVSKPVETIDENIKKLVDEMFVTVKKENGIGLAAPQVGENIRLFIVFINEQKYIFINPEIIETSQEMCLMEEGCLSIPNVYDNVMRPSSVRVQFLDIEGKIKTIDASGLLARVIQHENDHLNGILFIDRLSEEKKAEAIERFEHKKALSLKKRIRLR